MKKLLALILAAIMCLAVLASCGSEEEKKDEKKETEITEEVKDTAQDPEEDTAEPETSDTEAVDTTEIADVDLTIDDKEIIGKWATVLPLSDYLDEESLGEIPEGFDKSKIPDMTYYLIFGEDGTLSMDADIDAEAFMDMFIEIMLASGEAVDATKDQIIAALEAQGITSDALVDQVKSSISSLTAKYGTKDGVLTVVTDSESGPTDYEIAGDELTLSGEDAEAVIPGGKLVFKRAD